MAESVLANVLEALEYSGDKGLVIAGTEDVESGRAYIWHDICKKFQLDAVFFHGNVPVVCFKEFQSINNYDLWYLHRSLWNHNRVPILIVILPHEVRVYNCFSPPPREPSQLTPMDSTSINRAISQVSDVLAIKAKLSTYRKKEIVSGGFVRNKREQFKREQRVDKRLLDNLQHVRRCLIKDGLSESVANSLLGRSIFVRYLEDRSAINKEQYILPSDGNSFFDLLDRSLEKTYQFFDKLLRRFNGDMFPVSDLEREQVELQHLQRLGSFLRGDNISSGQMYFWAYNFRYIPIELISSIYETFLGDKHKSTSAYYTPPEVVDFILNELLPFDTKTRTARVLDPACGSGIFLVEAYRRLVINHGKVCGAQGLDFEAMCDLLKASIYGVDTSEDAIKVAAFSCYLALLDFLEPEEIMEGVRLPKLRGSNLFVSDFFNTDALFNELSYDIIVGNPPWKNELTDLADNYIRKNNLTIGGRQIAQAFLWRAPELLADGGQACLLAPSKGVLFNQSNQNRRFRQQFFESYQVTRVVDFSAFRHSLFREASSPMAVLFFQDMSSITDAHDELTHVSLHPSPLSEILAGIVVFGDEVRSLSYKQVVNHPYIWKVALWGTPRDLILIEDLRRRFHSLGDVVESRGWLTGKGVTVGGAGGKKDASELSQMRFVPAEAVKPFRVLSGQDERINHEKFHRTRDIKLFLGPHVLIRSGVMGGGSLASVFMPGDSVFKDTIIGIAGPSEDKDYLKAVCAYMNSSLARYYLFLTASTWGVERNALRLMEYKNFPCAIPVKDPRVLDEIIGLVDQAQHTNENWNWQPKLDKLVYRSYGITSYEEQVIKDFLETTLTQNHRGLRSQIAFQLPSVEELISYAQSFVDVFTETTGGNRTLRAIVYEGSSSYRATSFCLTPRGTKKQHLELRSERELDELLKKFEQFSTQKHGQSLYFRKNIKVFDADAIHIVKPAEYRFWTKSAAYNDADETIAQILRTLSLSNNEQATLIT